MEGKLKYYAEEGEKRLKAEEEEVLQGKFDEPEPEEEKHYDDSRRGGRGGRGGFRGGRGGRGGFRGGRGGAGPRRRDDQDGDDEVYHSSGDEAAQQKVTGKAQRPQNKKENLAVDDNNYPTL